MEMSIFISVRKERLPKMWGKTTIKDVASKCGVSTATVSRAINNNGYVSKELKDLTGIYSQLYCEKPENQLNRHYRLYYLGYLQPISYHRGQSH